MADYILQDHSHRGWWTRALDGLKRVLYDKGITNLLTCLDSREVMALMGQKTFVVLLDLSLPHITA